MNFRRVIQSAVFELFDAFRSRRAHVLVILYVVISALAMGGTITVLAKVEDQLAETLMIEKVEGKSGVVSATLWKSKPFQKIVRHTVEDTLVYDDICGRHPAELIHAWLVFLLVPMLTVLFSSNRVAGDVRSGSVRYMLTRVTRLEWSLGKYLGNALMILSGLLVGAVVAWAVAAWKLSGVDVAALLPAMVLWSFKAWFLALAWLGLALGISHFFQTPGKADGFAMLALFVFAVTPSLLRVLDDSDGFAGSLVILRQLFPSAVEDGLWRASFLPVAASAAWLVSLGLLYLSAGYAYFARRDAR
jgi:hypothetical protein